VELAIRELIRESVSSDELVECIGKSLRNHYHGSGHIVPTCLEEMTLCFSEAG
jgi:hypothetical protein